MSVVVAVLGDVGRSPRMQYHASSFASQSFVEKVTLIGYSGEKCMPIVAENNKIVEVRFELPTLTMLRQISSILFTLCKGLSLLIKLIIILSTIGHYDYIIIQNPPSIPLIIAAYVINIWRILVNILLFNANQ